MPAAPPVTNNAVATQFERQTAHGLARLRYVQRGDVLDLAHTTVPQEEEGQGIGTTLVRAALEHAKAKGLKVIPSCPFVRAYVQKHPEFAGLVAQV